MDSEINQVLTNTDKALDNFLTEIKNSPPEPKKLIEGLTTILKKNSEELQKLKKLTKDQVSTKATPETKLVQQLLTKLEMIKTNKTTQEKVGALQATLFPYIEDFQNILLNKDLKSQHKRGIRAEKVDPMHP